MEVNKHDTELIGSIGSAFIEFFITFNLKVEKRKRCLNVTKQIER